MGELVAISTGVVVGSKLIFRCAAMPVSSASVKGIIEQHQAAGGGRALLGSSVNSGLGLIVGPKGP